VSPALVKLRSDIQELVSQAPPIDLSTLAAASVIGTLGEVLDPIADQSIDGTVSNLTRLLQLQPNQLTMFKQRVSAKLKEELYKFFDKVYEAELSQLLDALAQQSPQTPFLRNKLLGISRTGQEKELNAIRSKALKLDEARRNPIRETPAPPPVSLPSQPVHHQQHQPQHQHQHQPQQIPTHHQPHQPTQPSQPQQPVISSIPTTPATPTPDPQRAQQEDAFCNAALSGDSQTVQTLLTQGVNVNCSQQGGWTALMNATLQGHATVVDVLIRAGADLNLKDNGGFTALMYAASYRRYPIAEALVKAGSNLDIVDNAGRNIMQYAQTDPQVKEAIQKGQTAREQQLAQQRQQTTPVPTQPTQPTQTLPSYGGYPQQQYPQGYPAPTQPTYGTPTPTYGTTPSYITPTYGTPGATPTTTPGTVQPTLAYGQYPQPTAYPTTTYGR
jgi:predicted house-cleaning noncanonical NTP pyrophosphatase (MazG superfamily)